MDLSFLGWLVPGVATVKAAETGKKAVERGNEMSAYNTYMSTIPTNNSSAQKLKTEWVVWYSGLSWQDKNLNDITYQEARNKVGLFDIANAPDSETREAVKKRLVEQGLADIAKAAADGTSVPIDTSTGLFIMPESDVLTTKGKWIVGGVVGVTALAVLGYVGIKIKKAVL